MPGRDQPVDSSLAFSNPRFLNSRCSRKLILQNCKDKLVFVGALRLDLRFLSETLNRQVEGIEFCDFCLLENFLKDGLQNACDSWLSVLLVVDRLPKFCKT
jgi:hypothetical protein